mgnify:CR=1 FL=1
MTTFALRFAVLFALPFAAATGAFADEKPYTPLAAEIGAGGPPPADLVQRAKAVADAVAAGSAEEVYAFVADRPTFVGSGITLEGARRIEKKGPYADAGSALAAIGLTYTEGELAPPTGKSVDMTASRVRTAMETIGDLLAAANWGRDPLVPGAWCTSRGVRWDAKAAKKAGLGNDRGVYVTEKVGARAEADAATKVVATLTPGLLYRLRQSDEENGFLSIVLPNGRIGWVPMETTGNPTPWSLCFEKGQAGWTITTFVSALL